MGHYPHEIVLARITMVCYLKHKAGTSLPFLVVGVAQLVRAPGCGPGGRGFDSLHSPHFLPFFFSTLSTNAYLHFPVLTPVQSRHYALDTKVKKNSGARIQNPE